MKSLWLMMIALFLGLPQQEVVGQRIKLTEGKTLRGHSKYVWSVAFSPDGEVIASGDEDSLIKIWSVESGQEIETLKGHRSLVGALQFNSNDVLSSVDTGGNAFKWDVNSGDLVKKNKVEARIPKSMQNDVVATNKGYENETIALIDIYSAKTLITYSDLPKRSAGLAISPDGKILAIGYEGGIIELRKTDNKQVIRRTSAQSEDGWREPRAMAFSSDGRILVSSFGQSLLFFKTEDLEQIASIKLSGSNHFNCVAFNSDNSMLATGSSGKIVRIWMVEGL